MLKYYTIDAKETWIVQTTYKVIAQSENEAINFVRENLVPYDDYYIDDYPTEMHNIDVVAGTECSDLLATEVYEYLENKFLIQINGSQFKTEEFEKFIREQCAVDPNLSGWDPEKILSC